MVVLSKQCNRKIRNKTPVARRRRGKSERASERARKREREPSELEILFLCNFRFAAPLFPQLTIEKSNRISPPPPPFPRKQENEKLDTGTATYNRHPERKPGVLIESNFVYGIYFTSIINTIDYLLIGKIIKLSTLKRIESFLT